MRGVGAVLHMVAGLLLAAAAWEIAGRARLLGTSWPPLSQVFAALTAPANAGVFERGLPATLREATLGYVIGIGVATISAVLCAVAPRLYAPIYRFSAVFSAIPVVAVAGLLVSVLPRGACPVVVSVLAVYFTAFVAHSWPACRAPARCTTIYCPCSARRAGPVFSARRRRPRCQGSSTV